MALQPRNFREGRSRGFSRHEWNNNDSPTGLLHSFPFLLVECIDRVISAFDINIRLSVAKKTCRRGFREDADAIGALESCQDSRPVLLVIDGTPLPLEFPHRVVAIKADQKRIAEIARRFEIRYVAG